MKNTLLKISDLTFPFIVAFLLSISFFLIMLCISCNRILEKYPQDNFIEEIVENVIKQETNLDLDLSPFSPENSYFNH